MASKNHLKQRLDPHKQEKYLGTERSPSPLLYVLAGVALLTGLFALSRTHYLLFHNLTELFSIAVAWSVFLLVWNTRRMASNDALLFLGIAYFFIGFMDLLHTLAYKGMGVFAQAQASNLAAQLWVTARGMEAISLLLFTILLGRRLWRWCTVAGFTALTVISLGSIFMWEAFPNCYIEGQGLTAIKTGAEYAICLVLVIAMTRLYGRREQLDANMLRLMIGAMALTIAAEMAFTLYSDVYGLSNAAGHFLKVISFSLVYQALVRSTVTRPHTTIFRELGQAKEKLVQEGRQLHLLQQISDLFLESRTLDGTLQELPKTIAAYFKTPIVAVELYEAGEQEMVFVGSIGIAATEENTKLRVPVDQTISGTVARTGQAVIYLNVGTHDDCSIQTLKDLNAVTFVCVPMTGQKGIIGTLTIADRRERPDIVDAAALIQILANNLAQEIRRRQQERRFLRLYHTMTQGVVIQDAQGKIIEANSAAGEILGLSPDQMLGRTACDPCWGLIQEDGSPYDPAQMPFDIALRTGKPVKDVLCGINVPKDHEHRWFVISSAPYFNRGEAKPSSAMTVFTDITERKHAESEHEATIQMLEILNAKTDLRELMNALLHFMRELSGCNAVGIRLKDGEDYLYYETSGFSNEFVAAETHLCVQDLDGQLVRDEMGNPVLECMCGNILCSRFDPTLPFFTDFGSFISNGTTELLANTSEEDRQARTRNRCNAEGYESVLLVPLRAGGETFGLLQFNDYRTGCFLPHFVGQAERMAGDVAIALAHRKA